MIVLSLLSGLLISVLFSCNDDRGHEVRLPEEITNLNTTKALRKYLEQIGRDDQRYRVQESRILREYGHDSEEHKEIIRKIIETDALNLRKIELIFEVHGHPDPQKVGPQAASVPVMVIHHAPSYEVREQFFPVLYKAWQDGLLDDDRFSLFLNRMYDIRFGKRFEIESPFIEEDRIRGIIDALTSPPAPLHSSE